MICVFDAGRRTCSDIKPTHMKERSIDTWSACGNAGTRELITVFTRVQDACFCPSKNWHPKKCGQGPHAHLTDTSFGSSFCSE